MLALTTSATVPNVSRAKVVGFTPPDLDVDTKMIVSVYFLPPPAGQSDAIQLARCYGGGPHVLRITNTVSDAISLSTDATVNPFSGLLVRGTVSVASLLDTCIAAISAAGTNVRNQLKALETTLSTAGVLPAGSVA
jgi:hypothetical protein